MWIALDGLGGEQGSGMPLARRVLAELRVDLVAPDGALAGTPANGLYVGPSTGSVGWRRFHGGSPSTVVATRLPVPAWERPLPTSPLAAGDAVAEPVAAGLLVRAAPAAPLTSAHPAFRIPMDLARPKLIIEDHDLLPKQVSALFDTVSAAVRAALLVVPLNPAGTGIGWISQLADLWSHDVVFSTGVQVAVSPTRYVVVTGPDSDKGFRPFPTVVRQRLGTYEQEVLDVAAPPDGWTRYSTVGYRMADGGPVAEVVPAGLVLRSESHAVSGPRAPFDPNGWTLTVGVLGEEITDDLVTAFDRLLVGAGKDRLRTVRVQVDGVLDLRGRARLAAFAHKAGVVVDLPAVPVPPEDDSVESLPATEVPAFPVATVSGPGTPSTTAYPPVAEVVGPEGPLETEVAGATESEDDVVVMADVAPWPERTSTSGEQARFSTAAGSSFADGLSMVNSAMATWPALRRTELGAKADYVAVCLYLTRGPTGAVEVNQALRAGEEVQLDSYLACLVSGLGRLPVHRRVVLRQARSDRNWDIGTVLTDPGFVSASVSHDVGVPDAEVDLLVWPVSARRTSELVLHRPIDEAVFLPGRRFKVLAVRTAEQTDDDDDVPSAPATTVLLRELRPDEPDARSMDEAALARLERAWEKRKRTQVRFIEEPDVVRRLTVPMVVAG
ncbi:hypothetical protein [Amycolatopsis sp. NPDC049868]|uniref:hypothetical protein n=1 Tax=Amycolatopsis sp. NPDC049868 TaxID=3363934 RepID=UPI003797C1D0